MKNKWLESGDKRSFVVQLRQLLKFHFGIDKIGKITNSQWKKVAKEAKYIYKQCNQPKINRLSDIDNF